MIYVGLVVNPYAGMGGSIGLKGTDGYIEEAELRGAIPQSPLKTIQFLTDVTRKDILFFTASGQMGEDELGQTQFPYICVYNFNDYHQDPFSKTDATDTKNACIEIMKYNPDVIIFCGGDGTARDVFSCTKQKIPIFGIPAGVKIYSGVFATTPQSASSILSEWNGTLLTDGEILDINEEQYRNGFLNTSLFGFAKIPSVQNYIQNCKQVSFGNDSEQMHDIARFIIEIMRDDTLYILGPGTTTKKITDIIGVSKTLLGIDAVYQKKLIGSDLNEEQILHLLTQYTKIKIIISPIGAQGFILGRGNQQISYNVLNITGLNSIIVIATESKLLNTQSLFVDTGDTNLNRRFDDTIQVICGYKMAIRKKLIH